VTVTTNESVLIGSASEQLGRAICQELDIAPLSREVRRFPDGEMQVELLESVRGRDVFVLQATSPPVEQHAIELLLLADACRRAGAQRLTGVIPYFGYARQDRRSGRRSLGARVIADVIATGGFDRLMLIDAHTPAIEGFFGIPIEHLTAVPLLAHAAARFMQANSVIIAPDLGAVKLARAYARITRLPVAFVQKSRLDGEKVETQGIVGEVRGRSPWIVDDMVSTGGTIAAAVQALRAAGAIEPIAVSVTHALLVGGARDLFRTATLRPILATDSVSTAPEYSLLNIVSVASLIATAIRRAHRDESLADLRASM
jgi:ribose-phosphate pyrophosphokinase